MRKRVARICIKPDFLARRSGLLAAAAPLAFGAEREPVLDLGEVVVTAQGPRRSNWSGRSTRSRPTTSVAPARARWRKPSTCCRALYVRYGADGTPRIDIRGLRTRNVLLFLDGVPLNSSLDGQFDAASIPVESIARIKVTRGGSSVLYGAGGNAGVINIITRGAEADGTDASVRAERGFQRSGTGARARRVPRRKVWRDGLGLVVRPRLLRAVG
jgi:vitamin B12 transporter